jgi:hypothetical protein
VTLPDLADRVADDIYTQRLPLCAASKVLPIGNRAELGRWRGEVRKILAKLWHEHRRSARRGGVPTSACNALGRPRTGGATGHGLPGR